MLIFNTVYMNYSDSQLQSQHINPEIKNVVGQISVLQIPQTKLNNTLSSQDLVASCPAEEK